MNWRMFFIIFWTIVAVITFSLLYSYVYKAATDEGYNMAFITRDIAFGITSALSVEGDVDIIYTLPYKFELEIKDGIVTLKYDKFKEQAEYIQNKEYKFEVEQRGSFIHIKKRNLNE